MDIPKQSSKTIETSELKDSNHISNDNEDKKYTELKETWLHLAILTVNIEEIKTRENEINKELLETLNPDRMTALHLACLLSLSDIVKLLVNKGANIHRTTIPRRNTVMRAYHVYDLGGNTPLHLAVSSGEQETITFLIESGASISIENDAGLTVYDLALVTRELLPKRKKVVLDLLIQYGSKIKSLEEVENLVALHKPKIDLLAELLQTLEVDCLPNHQWIRCYYQMYNELFLKQSS